MTDRDLDEEHRDRMGVPIGLRPAKMVMRSLTFTAQKGENVTEPRQ